MSEHRATIEYELEPVVNYAMQQNRMPIMRSLYVVNPTRDYLTDVDVVIESEPEFLVPYLGHIERISPNSRYEIKDCRLMLNGSFLSGLTERVTGLLTFFLKQGETVLYTEKAELMVLAYDELSGYRECPELVASFITPNDRSLVPVIFRAGSLMEYWTGSPSLDGYQKNDPDHVLKMAAAVFAALKEKNIMYALPPASFEVNGQRIRMPETVLSSKLGTCLDLSVLYASCLEAVGIRPIIVYLKGHAVCGFWLVEKSLPETTTDDGTMLTKRLADGVNELVLVECTMLAEGSEADFEVARAAGKTAVLKEDAFRTAVDIQRCRLSGIKPIPTKSQLVSDTVDGRPDAVSDPEAPASLRTVAPIKPAEKSAGTKKTKWERKLLDLGLKNTLINLRFTRTLVPLFCADIDAFEDCFSSGREYEIHARPEDWKEEDLCVCETQILDQNKKTVLSSEQKCSRLRSVMSERELNVALKELFRASRRSLEENGANTLYLAAGLLQWKESASESCPVRYAPIILIPIDMIRKAGGNGFAIRIRDEESRINVTLLEKLKQDFNIVVEGLDPLPQDDNGCDTRRVFTALRQAIMAQRDWDVIETVCLGIFSFSNFVMWNDIHERSADLEKNKIVKSLINGKPVWTDQTVLQNGCDENDVLLPIPADASQLYAIRAAGNGASFVLQGPPGTGKSQTITAMIANALAQKKTVLFIAEKMAALEVVQKRLEKIGIGDFCLELHSNKAKKRDVLERLRRVTERSQTSPSEYLGKAEKVAELRKQLDVYAKELHKELLCGKTLYELINLYEEYSTAGEIDKLPSALIEDLNAHSIEDMIEQIERLVYIGKSIGTPVNHPLSRIKSTRYQQTMRGDLVSLAKNYSSSLHSLQSVKELFEKETGLACNSQDDLKRIGQISDVVAGSNGIPEEWAAQSDLYEYLANIESLASAGKQAKDIREQLDEKWVPEAFDLPAERLLLELREINEKWAVSRYFQLNAFLKKLAPYMQNRSKRELLDKDLTELLSCQKKAKTVEELLLLHSGKLGSEYHGENTDWENILTLTRQLRKTAKAIFDIAGVEDARIHFYSANDCQKLAEDFASCWSKVEKDRKNLYSLLEIQDCFDAGDWILEEIRFCETLIQNRDSLKEFIAWNEISSDIAGNGMSSVVQAYLSGMDPDSLISAFQKQLYQQLIERTIDESDVLSAFSGVVFNDRIRQYKQLEEQVTGLAQKEIYFRLASNLPDFTREASRSLELGVLQKAIRSGGRGISIRKLFNQVPEILSKLCPCMLMSPISAAQYLAPERKPFDLVVFDEASQIETAKAVGALARGENAIIVGDPKQLPPTSFFAINNTDEEDESEDLESILDDCLAMNMPSTSLLWHYRSRHESLIAFSNSEFYENRLLTFPSVNDRDARVSFVKTEGVFDRGRTRWNRAEAEAVIEELKRRAKSTKEKKASVGVVTFNISQQNLIDDLLSEAAETDPELYSWVYESEEPLFIKNLENVQGDERDVILFSVGYGPDQGGKISMNFGPLNREGGWRRLNVAVTRARQEMKVFSSLEPEDIDLARTEAEGIKALKSFLQYAKDHMVTETADTARDLPETTGIIETIRNVLKEKGYDTDALVGRSEYRIDIGVIDRRHPERYLLGIILDGKSYADAGTTRDRELAQISILHGLGWNLIRVWSVDWWDNREKELRRIVSEIERLEQIEGDPEPGI